MTIMVTPEQAEALAYVEAAPLTKQRMLAYRGNTTVFGALRRMELIEGMVAHLTESGRRSLKLARERGEAHAPKVVTIEDLASRRVHPRPAQGSATMTARKRAQVVHECGYSKQAGTGQVPPCRGEICYVLRKYYLGPAAQKLGPDLYMCEAHGPWWEGMHPFDVRPKHYGSGPKVR